MKKPYYKKPRFELYQADSLEFLKELPESSVDMVFADPPTFFQMERPPAKTAEWSVSKKAIGI